MANYQSTHTGAEIDAGIDLLNNNSATSGQVLTANGTGGASWQNASGGGTEVIANPPAEPTEVLSLLQVGSGVYSIPTQWFIHRIEMSNTEGITEILFLKDTNFMPITDLNDLYTSIRSIEVVRYYKIQGDSSIVCSAFYVYNVHDNTLNLFAINPQGEIISIPVAFISDTVTPL